MSKTSFKIDAGWRYEVLWQF